jgi:integrase
MSVHKQGDKWRVKYRVNGRQRSRTYDRKGDAIRVDAEIKRRRQLGPALAAELDRSTLTLDGYVRGAWRSHAETLASATRAKYAWALERHLTELVDEPLLALDVARLAAHQQLLLERGASPSTVREVLTRLSGILQIAVEQSYVSANAARGLRKVPAEATDEVRPLSPVELERVIAAFDGRDRVVCLLGGHLGLRPLEIRSVPWSSLGDATLTVGRANTKRSASRTRTIAVPAITMRELREWRLRSGRRDDEPIIGQMTANALRLMGAKRLRAAITAATAGRLTDATTYSLRHSHASALHYSGFTVPEAVRRMGHGGALHLRTYAHVIESMSGQRHDDLDALITEARRELEFPQSSQAPSGAADRLMPSVCFPCKSRYGRSRTRTWDLFLIREAL